MYVFKDTRLPFRTFVTRVFTTHILSLSKNFGKQFTFVKETKEIQYNYYYEYNDNNKIKSVRRKNHPFKNEGPKTFFFLHYCNFHLLKRHNLTFNKQFVKECQSMARQ